MKKCEWCGGTISKKDVSEYRASNLLVCRKCFEAEGVKFKERFKKEVKVWK